MNTVEVSTKPEFNEWKKIAATLWGNTVFTSTLRLWKMVLHLSWQADKTRKKKRERKKSERGVG